MANLLNRSAVKEYIKKKRPVLRPGWDMTQVSGTALDIIEAKLENMIDNMIRQHPTRGRTFKEII